MKSCIECGAVEDVHEHHIIPRSRGGNATVPLCYSCHLKAHGLNDKGLNHGRLVSEGMARAKARGVKLGNPNAANDVKLAQDGNRERGKASVEYYLPIIQDAQKLGCKSLREISEKMNSWGVKSPRGGKISHTFIKSILDRLKERK